MHTEIPTSPLPEMLRKLLAGVAHNRVMLQDIVKRINELSVQKTANTTATFTIFVKVWRFRQFIVISENIRNKSRKFILNLKFVFCVKYLVLLLAP